MAVKAKDLIATATVVLVSVGCQTNHPPTTPSIISSNNLVDSQGSVSLQASSLDPDGDRLIWEWSADTGEFNTTTSPSVVWLAPEVSDSLKALLKVRVEDENGAADSAYTRITVVPKSNSEIHEVVVGQMEQSWKIPFDGRVHDFYRCQVLYLGSEIGYSGEVEKLYIMPASDATAYFHNFEVYLREVSRDQLVSKFSENYQGGEPVRCYYDPALGFSGDAEQWYEIQFNAPFHYHDSLNLLIELIWNSSSGLTVPTYAYQTSTFRRVGSEFEDALDGIPDTTALYIKLAFKK